MKSRERLYYWVTGGVLAGIIIGMCMSPLTAQDGKFGEITCTGLKVVNPSGRTMVKLTTDERGGNLTIWGKHVLPGAKMSIDDRGGNVTVWGRAAKSLGLAFMSIAEHGGTVVVTNEERSKAFMGIQAHGGMVAVSGKGDYPSAGMVVGEHAGDFGAWDKNGHRVK